MADDDPIWEPGHLLGGGAYEVRQRLGKGGMGEVYEAYDHGLARVVAVKALLPGHEPERLRQEARALAACRHPGVAAAYALATEGDVTYLVMERIYGVLLSSLIEQRAKSGSPLAVAEAIDLLVGVTEAVGAIHAVGIAHRDLKPDNILIAPGGRVVVIDFGIFAAECAAPADPSVGISGTPDYMAPEVARNEVRPGAAHLVDMYAIGVMAFEMLTGELPFIGENAMQVLMRHVTEPLPDVTILRPDLPASMVQLLEDLLRKDPDERPQSMEQLLWRLRALRGDQAMRPAAPTFSVLVVDDDANARMITDRVVRRAVPEADVVTASDGAAAVRLATQKPPHLMLLDLDLPGMNGIEVCLALRGTRAADRTAIVLVSGRARAHDLALLRQLGVTRFVEKGPDLPRNLAAAVTAVRARG